MAKSLVGKIDLTHVVMLNSDKGYDLQAFCDYVMDKVIRAIIPHKSNSK